MGYRSTREVVDDLRRHGRLLEIDEPFSPHLEIAEIQRRVYERGGPAVLFRRPQGCRFPMVSNLFGSLDQARFLFRDTLESVRQAIAIRVDPSQALRQPWKHLSAPWVAYRMLPKAMRRGSTKRLPVLANTCPLSELPQLVSWPNDGGPFVTLPQVLSQSVQRSNLGGTNLGMYRIQLAGNDYLHDQEVGLHYQIHRGIGVHHQEAIRHQQPFYVNCSVGGSPAMTLAAVMPLPEGMSELGFAGALAGYRIPMYCHPGQAPIYADADFCLVGEVDPTQMKLEGPFGDHLGYYSLRHDFPVLKIRKVYHRHDAVWPFTVVGRPPQEDTVFGELIHEITGPIIPTVIPGVKSVHAVDAAGVHPLLLAIGSERYDGYRRVDRPQELLTQANAILGQGQLSLAKYLLILDEAAKPGLKIDDIAAFLQTLFERVDFRRDLHFQTQTTIDTLDYSGEGLNMGSKLVIAASGPARRTLCRDLSSLPPLPAEFAQPKLCLPGLLALEFHGTDSLDADGLAQRLDSWQLANTLPEQSSSQGLTTPSVALVAIVDDATFSSATLNNFLWTLFTRSNPAWDVSGVGAFTSHKHWGCRGPLVIDARIKPHHAPILQEDKLVQAKIDAFAARGGPLAKYL